MVAAVGTRATEGVILVAEGSLSSVALRTSLGGVLATVNFPTSSERLSSMTGFVAVKSDVIPRVSNAAVLVAVKGRTSNPKLRAWTFTLDGHDYYVLRLGMKLTLVYDIYSEQWMDWDAFSETYWPVNIGANWVGGTKWGQSYGSNVLVGDDTYGLLWLLDPNQPYDEAPEVLDPTQEVFFPRIIQGQYPVVGRAVEPCYAVWLTTDMGAPAYLGAGVKLEISDDAGKSYQDMGTVPVTAGTNTPEIAWYSLGQIGAPGRLFRITDDGAVARIDSMEMNDPENK